MDPSWIQGHYSAEGWLGPGLGKPTPHSTEYFLCIYMARLVPVQTYVYSQLVSEKAERKSAMGGSLLKNSWLGRGCSMEMVLR